MANLQAAAHLYGCPTEPMLVMQGIRSACESGVDVGSVAGMPPATPAVGHNTLPIDVTFLDLCSVWCVNFSLYLLMFALSFRSMFTLVMACNWRLNFTSMPFVFQGLTITGDGVRVDV